MGRVMEMRQRDVERFAFLHLCGKRDKALLLREEKMTFSDWNRLMYLAEFLGMEAYALEVWNTYAGQFKEKLALLGQLYKETCESVPWDRAEEISDLWEGWIVEFCRQVPDKRSKERLKQIIKNRI